jgi:hypothetical protein
MPAPRLLRALAEIGAEIHDLTDRHLVPSASLLALPGPKLLRTRLGRLDVLGQLDAETSWDALVADSVLMDLGVSTAPIRVISLERLIAVKERVARLRDLLALPLLYAVRERLRKA